MSSEGKRWTIWRHGPDDRWKVAPPEGLQIDTKLTERIEVAPASEVEKWQKVADGNERGWTASQAEIERLREALEYALEANRLRGNPDQVEARFYAALADEKGKDR